VSFGESPLQHDIPSNNKKETISNLETPQHQEEGSDKRGVWSDGSLVMNGDDITEGGTNDELGRKDRRNMNQSGKGSQDLKPYQRLKRIVNQRQPGDFMEGRNVPHIPGKCQLNATRDVDNAYLYRRMRKVDGQI
jgi:hypothetical protein